MLTPVHLVGAKFHPIRPLRDTMHPTVHAGRADTRISTRKLSTDQEITAKGFSASILSARARGLVPSDSRSCGRLLRGLVSGPDRSRGVCEFVARTYCRRETGVQSLPFAQSIHCGESGQSPIPTSGGTRIGRGIQSVTFSQPRSQPRQSIRQTVVSTSFRT